MTKLEYLTRRWYETDQLRYRKLAEIRRITGDEFLSIVERQAIVSL